MYIGRVEPYIDGVTTFRGARVISPAQDTRVAGVSIFIFNSVSIWKQFCKPRVLVIYRVAATPLPPVCPVSGCEPAIQKSYVSVT